LTVRVSCPGVGERRKSLGGYVTQTAPLLRQRRRAIFAALGVAAAALMIALAARVGTLLPSGAVAATSSPRPVATSSGGPTPTSAGPTFAPPTAAPPTAPPLLPVLVEAPLTGLLVSPEFAARHPIAVMVDDHFDARPQSGFNAASVVWHAPAEGGIPRYMLIFQDTVPGSVGPVRSARQYYVEWAAEWRSMYVHAGGSPQAISTLQARGSGQWVYNADEFRWGGRYLWRTRDRVPPHNVYTDGEHLRKLAARLGADDGEIAPAWTFGADRAPALRAIGGQITVVYPYETIVYRYDRKTNRYTRFTCAYACEANELKKPQVDRGDGKVVAPKNVVILRMRFGALNDGHPSKHRLEAQDVGQGQAWIATNGRTIKGIWRKASPRAPTLLFDLDGNPITLTAGQTFVQVIATSYEYRIKDGKAPLIAIPVKVPPEP
jgi:hypothetical protein